jgi:hypothetical protein
MLGLVLAAFIIGGFVSWVAWMPKPAAGPLQAVAVPVAPTPTVAAAAPTQETPAATAEGGDSGATSQGGAAPESPAADAPVMANVAVPDVWAEETSARTRLPVAALRVYADAATAQLQQTPGCGISWNILAALADPTDVAPAAIDASSRALAAQLCENGADLTAPDGFQAALTSHGRTADQARIAATVASAYANAAQA